MDASTSRDDTKSSDLLSGGAVTEMGSSSAKQESVEAMVEPCSSPRPPSSVNAAVRVGSSSGTTMNGAGTLDTFQLARQPASVTTGLGCPAVDALCPTASMHDAVRVPAQPDAPVTVSASSSRSVDTATALLLAPTTSAAAGADAAMPVGRAAAARFDAVHAVMLIARLQDAASRDSTRSVGAGANTPPGSVVAATTDSHDTANVTG